MYRSNLLKILVAYTSDMHGQTGEHEKHPNCSVKTSSTVEVNKASAESILSSCLGTKNTACVEVLRQPFFFCYCLTDTLIGFVFHRLFA